MNTLPDGCLRCGKPVERGAFCVKCCTHIKTLDRKERLTLLRDAGYLQRVPMTYPGQNRTKDQKQATDTGNNDPWGDNATRAREG